MSMPTGRIKWFSPAKEYGFIAKEDGGEIFFSHADLPVPKHRRLFSGDLVIFAEVENEKGRKAVKVCCAASDVMMHTKGE